MIDICRICGGGIHGHTKVVLEDTSIQFRIKSMASMSSDHRFKRAREGTRHYAELTGADVTGWEESSHHPKKGWLNRSR